MELFTGQVQVRPSQTSRGPALPLGTYTATTAGPHSCQSPAQCSVFQTGRGVEPAYLPIPRAHGPHPQLLGGPQSYWHQCARTSHGGDSHHCALPQDVRLRHLTPTLPLPSPFPRMEGSHRGRDKKASRAQGH